MKVYVAIVLDEKTRVPMKIEVFKNKDDAQKFLDDNNSFNMPVEKIIRNK